MRRRSRPAVAALAASAVAVWGLGAAALATPGTAPSAFAATDDYAWGNVEIVGGGFVPGIVFNQGEAGLAYARTDVGGAYRLDPGSQRWTPLLDHVGWDDWNRSGVLSIAPDTVDTDNVYAMVGSYTNSWDPGNGAVLRSSDRGETWAATPLPFQVGGNMPGRGMGERLVVDPHDNDVLYMGTEGGHGLWRSTDAGVTWAEVTSFPNPGDYVQDPDDPNDYLTSNQGVVWVVFDPSSGSAGSATQTVYVGVADKENNVYRSTDAGATWERVPGQPTGFVPHKAVLDDAGQQLYVATSDTGGPYDGGSGDVWRLDVASGEWTQISPVPSSSADAAFGYSGLTIDRQDPDTIMVVSQISWWPDIQVYRSTDRGETWAPIWEWAGYPARTLHYDLDISGAPWLDFGKQPAEPEPSPKLGWMTESFEIDPFDSDRFLYGTGATVYGGENLTDWDTGGTVQIGVRAHGIEETAVQDLLAPAGPTELISGMYDIGGFVHDDISQVPSSFYAQPYHSGVLSLDAAGTDPSVVVRAGQGDGAESHLGVSTSGGGSWWAAQEPSGVTGAGTVAVNADGSRILWSPEGAGVHVSTTLGSSWTASGGVPAGARVEADRVDPDVFYAVAGGTFYTSHDGGATFAASPAQGLPDAGNVRFAAAPGHAGHVWLAGGEADGTYGMWRSTDAGATFSAVASVDEGDTVGFGKAAQGRDYPAVYTSSKIDGVRGIFRSDDAGASWVRINDDEHQYAWTGAAITGDPDVFGRVYVGTNGRGIVVGDFTGTEPDPTEEPTPDPTEEPTPEPTDEPGDGPCAVAYDVAGSWPGGFQGSVRVTNTGGSTVAGWSLEWDFTAGEQVSQAWGGTVSQSGSHVSVEAPGWATDLAPGASADVGFIGTGTPGEPTGFSVAGEACTTG
ncbi:cellulose binding domain-containing protein [Isoptericola luteus]|uniref:cellulose binding domain-containing protein n=1 Tax=Isoptericola luteus TaxID=2879484 RepID=UPI00272DA8E7|nr:cellulose binding domain-containing protein [Isoptericola sp. NEAU-Y5]